MEARLLRDWRLSHKDGVFNRKIVGRRSESFGRLQNEWSSDREWVKIIIFVFNSTALECFKELIVRCKYETLMQLIGKEDGWALFEDEKTFPDGVVVVARYATVH